VPTMGGAASIGRGSGGGGGGKSKLKGIPLRDISKLRKGKQRADLTVGERETRGGSMVRTLGVRQKAQRRLSEDRASKTRPSGKPMSGAQVKRRIELEKAGAFQGPDRMLSREKRRSIGRLIRSLEQRLIETVPQKRLK